MVRHYFAGGKWQQRDIRGTCGRWRARLSAVDPAQSSGRLAAAEVLFRVARDDAYATVVLDRAVQKAGLDAREAALATQIAYGALRVLPAVDGRIRSALHRPDRAVEPWAMAVLRCAVFELLHMRSASHAVVHHAVELIKIKRGAKLGAFANGVLRKVAKTRPVEPILPTAIELPAWLEQALAENLTEPELEAFRSRALPPPSGIAVLGNYDREPFYAELQRRGASDLVKCEYPSSALTFREGGDLRNLPETLRGRMRVMELGSQIVANALPVAKGMRVADCCAGRGGKSLVLASRLGSGGQVHALELHEKKLAQLETSISKLPSDVQAELAPVSCHALDLSVGIGGLDGAFDAVLVDLPCSGSGTVHRRPELLLRLQPERVAALGSLQEKILANSAALVRPEGLLLVAVCSLLGAEGPGLRAKFEAQRSGFELAELPQMQAIAQARDGVYRVGPWLQNADGFQLFALRRSA